MVCLTHDLPLPPSTRRQTRRNPERNAGRVERETLLNVDLKISGDTTLKTSRVGRPLGPHIADADAVLVLSVRDLIAKRADHRARAKARRIETRALLIRERDHGQTLLVGDAGRTERKHGH